MGTRAKWGYIQETWKKNQFEGYAKEIQKSVNQSEPIRQEWSGGRGNKDHTMVSAEGLLKQGSEKDKSLHNGICHIFLALTKKPFRINWQGAKTNWQTDQLTELQPSN